MESLRDGLAPGDDDSASPLRVFLDPRGRLSRRGFWLYGVLALLALSLLGRALLDIARLRSEDVDIIVNGLLLWPALAISAKRWHDRDRSGWWVLVALIPLVGWLWMLLDNGFVRGTPGPNRFGPVPDAASRWIDPVRPPPRAGAPGRRPAGPPPAPAAA